MNFHPYNNNNIQAF
jgi:hypothetical protein